MKTCSSCQGSSFVLVKKQINGWLVERCRKCGLVQIAPKPSKQDVAALYEHDWPHFSPYQSQRTAHLAYFKKLLSFVLSHRQKKREQEVLDVGSATGILLSLLKRMGIQAVGIDVSKDAVSYCRKRGLEAYYGSLFDVSDKKKWTSMFDIIFVCQVVEHDHDPLLFFQTVGRILKPDGMVIVTTPNHDTMWRKIMGKRWIGYQHPEHLFFFTPSTLSTLMSKSGLQVTHIRSDFGRPYSVSYAFRRLGCYIPGLRWIFHPFERLFKNVHISVPFNPWGDMLLIGRI